MSLLIHKKEKKPCFKTIKEELPTKYFWVRVNRFVDGKYGDEECIYYAPVTKEWISDIEDVFVIHPMDRWAPL